MHREHMDRAILAAGMGSTVAIFTPDGARASALATDVEDATPAVLVDKVRRTNGNRAIFFRSGGSIRFISVRQSARGLSLDRAFVPVGLAEDVLADIIPSLCTSQEGVLTGY